MASPDRSYYEKIVFEALYPKRDKEDPRNFKEFVNKFILKEVRWENVRYYGSEKDRGEELDALYPGHDYSSASARVRLGQFQAHRRLFEVFDQLRLKPYEIDLLCTWEGTKGAKDRYEKQTGIKVVDKLLASLPAPEPLLAPRVTHHYYPVPTPSPKLARYNVQHLGSESPCSEIIRDYYGNPYIWGTPCPTTPQLMRSQHLPATPISLARAPARPARITEPGSRRHWYEWMVRNISPPEFDPENTMDLQQPIPRSPGGRPTRTQRRALREAAPHYPYTFPHVATVHTTPTPMGYTLGSPRSQAMHDPRRHHFNQQVRAQTIRALGEGSLESQLDRSFREWYAERVGAGSSV